VLGFGKKNSRNGAGVGDSISCSPLPHSMCSAPGSAPGSASYRIRLRGDAAMGIYGLRGRREPGPDRKLSSHKKKPTEEPEIKYFICFCYV
jgi:hypothetical protein